MIPAEVDLKFSEVQPQMAPLSSRIDGILRPFCDDRGWPMVSRLKTLQSLSEKIETGRFGRWSELDDIWAYKIIIPTRANLTEVIPFLDRNFTQLSLKERSGTKRHPSSFGFDAVRYIGTLKPGPTDDTGAPLFHFKIEIQVPTAFEHAWSVTTHSLAYKSQGVDWRFLRLAAQLKAATEQLDSIIDGFQNSATFIVEQPWPEINFRKRIERYFEEKISAGLIPTEAAPSNWTRFTESALALLEAGLGRHLDFERLFRDVTEILDNEIAKYSGEAFPRSISLFQFVLGTVIEREYIQPTFSRFHALVTQALQDLYPKTARIESRFAF